MVICYGSFSLFLPAPEETMILISVLIPVQTTKPNRRKQSMNSLLIKNTSAVITCDSKDTVMEHANILINNGVISYMVPKHRPQTKRWMHPDISFIRDLSTRIIIFIRHSAGISLKYRIWNFSTGSPPYMKSGKIWIRMLFTTAL